MRTSALTILLAAAGIAAAVLSRPATAQDSAEVIGAAIATELASGKFAAISARFTPEMTKALPVGTLEKVWVDLRSRAGPVRKIGTARIVQNVPVVVVTVPLEFEQGAFDLQVTITAGKVAGLFIVPSAPPPVPWSAASYVDASTFEETEVEIGKAPWALQGTLSLPRGRARAPAVVLVHGSGPNDRNETIGANRPFQDLAGGLASRGIAVLRYEKRTKTYPAQFAPSQTFTVREETIEDAVEAIALLRTRSEIDPERLVIVGHSLGGMLAPRIAKEEPRIAGVVIMAGAARPIYDLIVEQVEYLASLDGPPAAAALDEIAKVKAAAARARVAKVGDPGPPILGVPPAYWADLNAYDAAATAGSLTLPMLILQGGRDYQATGKDLERFKAALAGHSNATVQEFPNLNHLFMAGEGKSRPEEYNRLGHVDAAVIEAITAFVSGLAQK